MSVEDKHIARLLHREVVRRQGLDVSEVKINVMRGVGYLGGVIRPAPGVMFVNMKEELKYITEGAKKVPGLRDLVIDARIETSAKK